MPRIPRFLQKVFGGNLTAPGNIEKFGSCAAGAPDYSLDPALIQTAAWLNGWAAATKNNSSPVLQDRNGVDYEITLQLAYLTQQGLAEWRVDQTYYVNNFAAVNGVIFISTTDGNVGNNPVTDTNNWKTLASTVTPNGFNALALPRAWCAFDGTTIPGNGGGTIPVQCGYGISNVQKIAGSPAMYKVLFDGTLTTNNYSPAITCGSTPDVLADFPRIAIKDATFIQFASETVQSAQGQSRFCSVQIFGPNPLT